MRLKRLDIRGFGQLRGVVDLESGRGSIALLLERNEAGKSTLAAAITGALYGLDSNRVRHRNRMTPLDRYRPWGGGNYGLELLLTRTGHELRITRDFESGFVEVREGTKDITGEFRRGKQLEIGEILTGLTRAQFELSAFVPQGEIVWDDPSALAEALQRAADSQGGENTAAQAIAVLQSGLDQYEGTTLKRGKVQTEVQRCAEEMIQAQEALDQLETRRAELDARINELRRFESDGDEARVRRDALRLRRAATDLAFERDALADDDRHRARHDELRAQLAADPSLELINEAIRPDLQGAWRRHGMLERNHHNTLDALRAAEQGRDTGRVALQQDALQGTPTHDQVTELGAWCHARKDQQADRAQLRMTLEAEHAKLRAVGFDPVQAARLGERFAGLSDRDRALLGGLRKQRMELEDEEERLHERRAAATIELEGVDHERDQRRQRGYTILIVGLILGVGGLVATRFTQLLAWAAPIPGAVVAMVGIVLAGSAGAHRSAAAATARTRLDDLGEELRRFDDERHQMQEELQELASRLQCSAAELEESWRAWGDLQPHTSSLAVVTERLARVDAEEDRLVGAVASLQTLVGHAPALDELDALYTAFQKARALADQVAAAEAQRVAAEKELQEREAAVEASEADLRARLMDLGVPLDEDEDLQTGFARFDDRAASSVEMARIRDGELPQLEQIIASPEQRARREERVVELARSLELSRPQIELELAALAGPGQELIELLDESLTEEQLQQELVRLESDSEQRHGAQTRQLTEVRSFVERYEREAPELRERIEELEIAGRKARQFADAVELARDTLDELAQQTHEVWSRELAAHTNRTLAAMGTDLGQVQFDDQLNLSLVQRGQRMSGAEARQALSTGARDVLHLACRLALAHFLSAGELQLPLILDDPFAHCDDGRTIAGMKALLDSIAPEHQVILLACQRSRYDWVRSQLSSPDRIRVLGLEDRA